eukprot:g2122.t1
MMKIKVRFADGRGKRYVPVRPWSTVKDLKDRISEMEQLPARRLRMFQSAKEVPNTFPLTHAEEDKSFFCVLRPNNAERRSYLEMRNAPTACDERLRDALMEARFGMQLNLRPKLADDGLGGTYFLRGRTKRYVACFKPKDEEPGGPNNPRGLVGPHAQVAIERGIMAGEACDRELAAYLLDHKDHAGVPPTALAESSSWAYANGGVKVGMLQVFCHHDDVAGNLSHSLFPVHEVHKIALLDIRLVNTDRNDANILVQRHRQSHSQSQSQSRQKSSAAGQRKGMTLVPIDHGYCLPAKISVAWCDWCWLSWPQTKQPMSAETLSFIESLDPWRDARRLHKETAIPPTCTRNMIISTLLLKIGAARGLTIAEIAEIMCRAELDVPSDLEVIVQRAEMLAESMMRSPRMRHRKPAAAARPVTKVRSMAMETQEEDFLSTTRRETYFTKYLQKLIADLVAYKLSVREKVVETRPGARSFTDNDEEYEHVVFDIEY